MKCITSRMFHLSSYSWPILCDHKRWKRGKKPCDSEWKKLVFFYASLVQSVKCTKWFRCSETVTCWIYLLYYIWILNIERYQIVYFIIFKLCKHTWCINVELINLFYTLPCNSCCNLKTHWLSHTLTKST